MLRGPFLPAGTEFDGKDLQRIFVSLLRTPDSVI